MMEKKEGEDLTRINITQVEIDMCVDRSIDLSSMLYVVSDP